MAEKTVEEYMQSIQKNQNRVQAVTNQANLRYEPLELSKYARTAYSKDLREFVRATKKQLEGVDSKVTDAIEKAELEVKGAYESILTGTWSKDSWDKSFAAAKKALTDVTDPKFKSIAAAQAEKLEAFRTEKFKEECAVLDKAAERQVGLYETLSYNKTQQMQFGWGDKYRLLPKPVTIGPPDEDDIEKEEEKNDPLFEAANDDDKYFRRQLKKFRESKAEYYECQDGLYKGKMIEYREDGSCRPKPGWELEKSKGLLQWVKNKITNNAELDAAAIGAALDVMLMKDARTPITFGLPVISEIADGLKRDGDSATRAKAKEILFTANKLTPDFIRKNFISVLKEAEKRPGAPPIEMDQDLENYLIRVRYENQQKLFPNKLLEATIKELFDLQLKLMSAPERNRIVGENEAEMQYKVREATKKLNQQSDEDLSKLKKDYDQAYEEGGLAPSLSAVDPLKEKQDVTAIQALRTNEKNEKSSKIDREASPGKKIELIEKEIETLAAYRAAAVDAEKCIVTQMAELGGKVTEAEKQGYEPSPFVKEQVEKLNDLRKLQEEKVAELAVKAKLLHLTVKEQKDIPEKNHQELIGKSTKCLDDVMHTQKNSEANLAKAIQSFRGKHGKEAAKELSSPPGGPSL